MTEATSASHNAGELLPDNTMLHPSHADTRSRENLKSYHCLVCPLVSYRTSRCTAVFTETVRLVTSIQSTLPHTLYPRPVSVLPCMFGSSQWRTVPPKQHRGLFREDEHFRQHRRHQPQGIRSAEIKRERIYTSTLLYTFMVWFLRCVTTLLISHYEYKLWTSFKYNFFCCVVNPFLLCTSILFGPMISNTSHLTYSQYIYIHTICNRIETPCFTHTQKGSKKKIYLRLWDRTPVK
jgi:hypothetical protein